MTDFAREADLVNECRKLAAAMGAYLEVVGQRRAKGSGTTIGAPDAFLYASGKCLPCEFKRRDGRLSAGQALAQHKRMDQHVHTWIIRSTDEFISLVNAARRGHSVQPDTGGGER